MILLITPDGSDAPFSNPASHLSGSPGWRLFRETRTDIEPLGRAPDEAGLVSLLRLSAVGEEVKFSFLSAETRAAGARLRGLGAPAFSAALADIAEREGANEVGHHPLYTISDAMRVALYGDLDIGI